MADQQPARSMVEHVVAVGKDAMVVLRDGALLALAALLLLFPARLNDILVSAGFEEGSFVGFKWKSGLVQTTDALKAAQQTINELKGQLEKTNAALAEAQAHTSDPSSRNAARELETQNQKLTASVAQVEDTLRSTIRSNAPLVERAQAAVTTSGGWGVVFGSDVSLSGARDEIQRASKQGMPAASIYKRNNYFASIAVVDDRARAQEYLAIAKKFRPDAYISSMATWCRNQTQQDGYIECQSR